ncbi:MAG: ribosomal-processing cysteine protease Prp [Clostridia bacterium]|nr:ribosomal-processing cysteine protease Prp [Clostridia bacterium]
MTDIKIEKKGNSITKVSCSGHAGYACEGEDIVCAGISTLVQTALLGLLQVAKINLVFDRDCQQGSLNFAIPQNVTKQQRHDADVILDTMLCGLSDFQTEYSDYMNLEVVQNVH